MKPPALNLCDVYGWEPRDRAEPGTRELLLSVEDDECPCFVFVIDPRNLVAGIRDDDAMEQARGVAFSILGACGAIDNKRYQIIDPEGNRCVPLFDAPDSPESDIERARRLVTNPVRCCDLSAPVTITNPHERKG